MSSDEELKARLLAASPDLFTLLIKARNELALLGKMAPLSKLCLEIDNTINLVRGDTAQGQSNYTTGGR